MAHKRTEPEHDRLITASLTAAARRLADWQALSPAEAAAAVRELQDAAEGRSDLLAEVAGLLLGFYEGDRDEPKARRAAELCLAAGADEDLIQRWTEEGRLRAANGRQRPVAG